MTANSILSATAELSLPYLIVEITLNDHNGNPILGPNVAQSTLGFIVGSGFVGFDTDYSLLSPGDTDISVPATTLLIAAAKYWAAHADWNTGFNWADQGVATPVSYSSVAVTLVNAPTETAV